MNLRTTLLGLTLLLAPTLAAADSQDFKDAGLALYRSRHYEKALDYFQKAVQADPNDYQAYEELGDTYSKMNDSPRAREAYEKSLKLHPANPSLRARLADLGDDLEESQAEAPAAKNNGGEDSLTDKAEPWHQNPGAIRASSAGGGLSRIDRSRLWLKLELGYTYSRQDDLANGAAAYNDQIAANGWSGTATASSHGFNLGGELGFLINPYNGIALGARVLRATDYHLDVNYEPGLTLPDYQTETFQPWVVPLTLDYYLFLPDSTGRFFLSAGVGYYRGLVRVYDDYDLIDAGGNADTITGDLTAGDIGFQVGLGREWAINNRFGISVYGRGRYAKLSHFTGTLRNAAGQTGDFGLETSTVDGVVDIDNTYNISAVNSERYTTIDFTGFDVGLALTWYSY